MRSLRSKYSSQLSTAKELFPDWTDEDILFALQEANGDVEVAIVRMSEGTSPIHSFLGFYYLHHFSAFTNFDQSPFFLRYNRSRYSMGSRKD